MEPVDYGGVLLKRWWVPVALGFVCALAAVLLIPGASKHSGANASPSTWTTSATVGSPPPASRNTGGLGSGLTTQQIVFYSSEHAVLESAAKAAGITTPLNELVMYAIGPAPKIGIAGQVGLIATGSTPAESAALTNAYAKALGDYINGLLGSTQQAQLQQVQQTINNLKWEIAANGSKVPASLTAQLSSAQADQKHYLRAFPRVDTRS